MNYMQKMEQLAQANLDIGFNAEFQAATDLWMVALAQEQIDRVLKPLCSEAFVPFRERNEWVRKLKYGKGAKK